MTQTVAVQKHEFLHLLDIGTATGPLAASILQDNVLVSGKRLARCHAAEPEYKQQKHLEAFCGRRLKLPSCAVKQ